MVYEWKTNLFKVNANVAGSVCEELKNTVGLTKESLVEASRPVDAPLHGEFEWDDRIAAEEYRKGQAGLIIRNLAVVMEEGNGETVRAFFKTETSHKGVFESIQAIMADSEKRNSLLDIAIKELQSFKKKYSMLKELASVFEEIDKLGNEVTE